MSAPTKRFRGRIEGGRICLNPPGKEELAALIQHLEGREISLVLKRWANQRTSPQSRYYFGVVLAVLGEHLGYEIDDLHHELKRKFLAVDPDAALVKVRSTADLSTAEFTEYIEQVRRFAATDFQCYVPDPNEIENASTG